jgi:hypothetical protein
MNRPPAPHQFVQASHENNSLSDYMPGFGNDFETETLSGALPQGMNNPQKAIMASMENNSQARPLRPPALKTSALGVIGFDLQSNTLNATIGLIYHIGKRPPILKKMSRAWDNIVGILSHIPRKN